MLDVKLQKKKLDLDLLPVTKINCKWIKDLKLETMKFPEGNRREVLQDIEVIFCFVLLFRIRTPSPSANVQNKIKNGKK